MESNDGNNFFDKSREVFQSLEDEISRETFLMRMCYNVSQNHKFCLDMAEFLPGFKNNEQKQYFQNLYRQCRKILESNRNVILYGAGDYGKIWTEWKDTIHWLCVCDKDKEKQKVDFMGYQVISPEALLEMHKEDYVFIGALKYAKEIINELIEMGFPKTHIIECDRVFELEILFEAQYFDEEIIKPEDNEIFIDGGSYNLDTTILFQRWCNNKYEKIYAFEPDLDNYNNCKRILEEKHLDKVELYQAGLWSENTQLHFDAKGTSASTLDDQGVIIVPVVSIDEILQGKRVSFIKMDIEGAELKALEGARETILKYRPKLAICLYHKTEDIIEIPLYLRSLISDYKIYIRHYSTGEIETVLYAT
ncbi:MAG: FkbM family methyltransferase [Mobilitalea sp.]